MAAQDAEAEPSEGAAADPARFRNGGRKRGSVHRRGPPALLLGHDGPELVTSVVDGIQPRPPFPTERRHLLVDPFETDERGIPFDMEGEAAGSADPGVESVGEQAPPGDRTRVTAVVAMRRRRLVTRSIVRSFTEVHGDPGFGEFRALCTQRRWSPAEPRPAVFGQHARPL